MLQSHCHVLAATLYLHVDLHGVDNIVPISASCHVVPRSSHAVASLKSRYGYAGVTLCLVMHRWRHARATLCLAAATLRSVCSLVVSRSYKTQSARLANPLLMPQSHCHVLAVTFIYVAKRGKTWLQRVQTWNNVVETGQSMTKRELEIWILNMFKIQLRSHNVAIA
jgi:hypothetical protein